MLEKIIRYEAVHAIQDWSDLRGRLDPRTAAATPSSTRPSAMSR
ncbi:malonyl-CoA decarboxylase domain-containing protein [Cobetia marina]